MTLISKFIITRLDRTKCIDNKGLSLHITPLSVSRLHYVESKHWPKPNRCNQETPKLLQRAEKFCF